MAENQKPQEKKLSYDELNQVASDLHVQYQKLMIEYQKAVEALQARDFDYLTFFLQCLFKVVEHPEMYSEDFVNWAVSNIEKALRDFHSEATKPAELEKKNEA